MDRAKTSTLTISKESRGRSRSRSVSPGSPKKGGKANSDEKKEWHINPLMIDDPDMQEAAENDEDFGESFREASRSRERSKDKQQPRRSQSHGAGLRIQPLRPSHSGGHGSRLHYSDDDMRFQGHPSRPLRRHSSDAAFPPGPLHLETQNTHFEPPDLKISVEPLSPRSEVRSPTSVELEIITSRSNDGPETKTPKDTNVDSPGRRGLFAPSKKASSRKKGLEILKRESIRDTARLQWATKCVHCKFLITGRKIAVAQEEKCASCTKHFQSERISVFQCQSCFTWTEANIGTLVVACPKCQNVIEVLPIEVPEDLPTASRSSISKSSATQASIGLANALTHGVSALLPKQVRTSFETWCGTIKTDFEMMQPTNDEEIRKLIREAKAAGLTLRVVGHSHSQSPMVCAAHEPAVLLMRLNHYKQATNGGIEDFKWMSGKPGDPTREVWVNAGWSIAQMYKKCTAQGYFLFSQTAANPFSVGGYYMNTVHGSSVSESVMSTRCTGLRAINAEGAVVIVDKEEELRMWRSSMGCGGIVTHVVIRLQRFTSVKNSHVKVVLELTPKCVQECILDVIKNFEMCEFFFDPYENQLLIARWNGENDPNMTSDFEKNPKRHTSRASSLTDGLQCGFAAAEVMAATEELRPVFSQKASTLKQAFEGMHFFLTKDANGPNSMFAVDWATQCVFMAYFIPIHSPADVIRALKGVLDVHRWSVDTKQLYGLDSPIEWRFVRGNSNAVWSAVWEPPPSDEKERPAGRFVDKQLWMSIEIIAYCGALDPTFSEDSHLHNQMTASFQEYWYRVEQNWRAIPGATPHPAKLFGLEPRPGGGYRSFAPRHCHSIWKPQQKELITEWLAKQDPHRVFYRQFLKQLLAEPSPEDDIDPEAIQKKANKPPDAVHSTLPNINDLRGGWFLCVTVPYWLSGMTIHLMGFFECLVLLFTGLATGDCSETVEGWYLRDCGQHATCTQTAMWWIRAWFIWRGVLGLFVAPFHLLINCRRVYVRCYKLENQTKYFKSNSDDNSKVFWRCLPLCDIFIAFTLGFAMVCMEHMAECGLKNFVVMEAWCMIWLVAILAFRVLFRLRGEYFRVFHFDGDGTFMAQNKFSGSWHPFKPPHRSD